METTETDFFEIDISTPKVTLEMLKDLGLPVFCFIME
jgi:hypothetical protein